MKQMQCNNKASVNICKLLFIIVPALFSSGCAFTDINLKLPTTFSGKRLSGGDGREIVIVTPFADQRDIQERCGMQKNGYNMDTADALCDVSPAARLAELLAGALRNAGFEVKTAGEAEKLSGVEIEGTLLKFFVEPVMGFAMGSLETDVHVRLVASSRNGLNAERSFFIKGTRSAVASSAGNFQRSVDDAIEQTIRQMVAAIISLFNRYPQLGQFAPATIRVSRT